MVQLPKTEEFSILTEFISYGVEKDTVQNLVKKYKAGHMLDSMNPRVEPVKREAKLLTMAGTIITSCADL